MEEKSRPIPYPLRMPDELRTKLESSAKDGSRSLHAEIVARLSESFQGLGPGDDSAALILDQATTIWQLKMQLASAVICLEVSKGRLEQMGAASVELVSLVNDVLETNAPIVRDIRAIPIEKLALGNDLPWSDLYEQYDELQKDVVDDAPNKKSFKQHFKDGDRASVEGGVLAGVMKILNVDPAPKKQSGKAQKKTSK